MANQTKWGRRSYTKSEFIHAWNSCKSKSDVARKLNLKINGGNINTISKNAMLLGLDDNHFDIYWQHRLENPNRIIIKKFTSTKEELLTKLTENNYISNTHSIKHQLYKHGLKEKACEECGLTEWRGKPAPLALDHVDGDRSNNALGNLRILCYNCHGQTDTYAGKKLANPNKQKEQEIKRAKVAKLKAATKLKFICFCGNKKSRDATECITCSQNSVASKVADRYPPLDQLIMLIQKTSYVTVSKQLGVSDNAIKKHLKKRLPAEHPVLNIKPRK